MKFGLLAAATLLYSSASFATVSESRIYESLDVQATSASAGQTADHDQVYTVTKSVGGLTCVKFAVARPGSTAEVSCQLDGAYDAKTIYETLEAPEYDGRPTRLHTTVGANILVKSVGALTCTKRAIVYREPTYFYSCKLEQ